MENRIYDMIVVGGGPGGYTAALYAARAGLDTLVIEQLYAGGQMAQTHKIDNYPGFPEGIDGFSLAQQMEQQAKQFGVNTANTRVKQLQLEGQLKRIETEDGSFLARAVVIATGATPRKLGLPREQELTGRGVAYCAACDGMFYRGKTVAVVGGGNSAVAEALLLSRVAQKVILIHRKDTLRAEKLYHAQLEERENIEFRWNTRVAALLGEEKLTGLRLQNVNTAEEEELRCDGVFVSIGRVPASELVRHQLELDENGYIPAGEDTATGIPGVYAVGDVRTKLLRQIVTAVADGAVAAHEAQVYLSQIGGET